MAKRSSGKQPPVTPPSLDQNTALLLLRRQIEEGKRLLAARALNSEATRPWYATTRDVLIRARGSDSSHVASFNKAGAILSWASEQEQADVLKVRLAVVEDLAGVMEYEIAVQTPATHADGPQSNPRREGSVTDLGVFVSWSGDASLDTAAFLRHWLEEALPGTKCWMSKLDIPKGRPWFPEIMGQLARSRACLVCITPENIKSPWLYYEAGVIAAGLAAQGDLAASTHVCAYLIGVQPGELSGTPLGQFQATVADEQDTLRLILSLNGSLAKSHDAKVLQSHFNASWGGLKQRLDAVAAKQRVATAATAARASPTAPGVRALLVELLREGRHFTRDMSVAVTPQLDREIRSWCDRVEAVLRKYLDEAYVLRFQVQGSRVQVPDMSLMQWWEVTGRLERLEDFLKEIPLSTA